MDKRLFSQKAREKARKNGFCTTHTNTPVAPGFVRCQECLNYRKNRDEQRRKLGLCADCNANKRAKGYATCLSCKYKRQISSTCRSLSRDEKDKAKLALETSTGFCEVCGKKPNKRGLHIDHCHVKHIFRGLLCSSCNQALGNVKDNPLTLRLLALYVENFQ
jgi:Recombination endonuclease VII